MKLKEKLEVKNSLSRRDFIKNTANKCITTVFSISILSSLKCRSDSIKMPKRLLGRTKLSVSQLGFGCTQVRDKAVYQRAVDLGINYFHMGDRDPTYNLEACKALFPFRKKINIAYMSHPKSSKDLLLDDLDSFLQQSGLGYLDVWFVITPGPEVLTEFSEAIIIAQKEGKIRWAGITTHNLDSDVIKLTSPDSKIDVVMMTYNYLSPQRHREILDKLYIAELGIMPMKPLAGKFYEKATHRPDALIRWLASDERIHTIPIIMNTTTQVEQNIAAIKQSFTDEDLNLLQTLYSYNSKRFCRMCGACNGKCVNGLAVSDLVRSSMYVDGYKNIKFAQANFFLIAEKQRHLLCDNCDKCSVICPNGVAIKQRIRIIKECFV